MKCLGVGLLLLSEEAGRMMKGGGKSVRDHKYYYNHLSWIFNNYFAMLLPMPMTLPLTTYRSLNSVSIGGLGNTSKNTHQLGGSSHLAMLVVL